MTLGQHTSTLALLADRWGSAGALVAGFPLLARGHPVGTDEIARVAGLAIGEVEDAVEVARCERDEQGRLIDLYGLTLAPTLHRLSIGGKVLFSCCALWAHVIPKLVDSTVQVESVDPLRRELVMLSISPSGIEGADPSGPAATLTTASREAIAADVGAAFCSQVRHFVSRESAEQFAAMRPSCYPIELDELQAAADELHRSIWRTLDA